MRAFPLAVSHATATDDAARDVVLHQAALTHPHPAAGWGAWLGVAMMRAGIRGDDPFVVLEAEIARIPDEHRDRFASMLAADWTPADTTVGNGSVWGCLAQAVWAVRCHGTFAEAVIAAIDLGDDTDTVACVTGAIAGSIAGVDGIPCRWLTHVHGTLDTPDGRRSFDHAGLQRLTWRLLGGDMSPDEPDDETLGPTRIAPGLHAANLLGAMTAPEDWAVISLDPAAGHFDSHPVRREIVLVGGGAERWPPAHG